MEKLKSVCVEDFWGNDESGEFISFTAFYFPALLTTYFEGNWSFVPPLFTSKEPTSETVNHWANYHASML